MYVKNYLKLLLVVLALAIPLMFVGTASAKYMGDGAVPNGNGGWLVPSDGICVTGLAANGTLSTASTVTVKRDCDALRVTTSGTTKAQCTTLGTVGNDGQVHAWAGGSTCVTVDLSSFPSKTI